MAILYQSKIKCLEMRFHTNYYTFKADSNFALGEQMGKAFKKEAKQALEANRENWERKLEIARKLLEVSENNFPKYVDELKGYAKGAEVDFLDFWTVSLETDVDIDEDFRCTNIITNSGKLMAHNEDHDDVGLENSVCVVRKEINGLGTLEVFYYNTVGGCSMGVNSFGFAQSMNTLNGVRKMIGIPRNFCGRAIQDAAEPLAEIEKLKNLPRVSGYNHNIIDPSGKILNVELTSQGCELTFPNSPFVHTNHCLLGDLGKTKPRDDHGTVSRLKVVKKLTKNKMTTAEVKEMMNEGGVMNERTIAKMMVDFERMVAEIWLLREKDLGWVEYPLDFVKS